MSTCARCNLPYVEHLAACRGGSVAAHAYQGPLTLGEIARAQGILYRLTHQEPITP